MIISAVGIFLIFAGLIIGLGSVTVLDIHGYLARYSPYWTLTIVRAHKVIKPLIWVGMFLHLFGTILLNAFLPALFPWIVFQYVVIGILLINGVFLSFFISPMLILREKEGKSGEVLPKNIQHSVLASFLLSFFGWWTLVVLCVLSFTLRLV